MEYPIPETRSVELQHRYPMITREKCEGNSVSLLESINGAHSSLSNISLKLWEMTPFPNS